MNSKLLEMSDVLKELRDKKRKLEFELKGINAEMESYIKDMLEIMATEELTSFKRNGATFTVVINKYPSPEPERKDELWEVMKDKGYEHLFTINSKTLQATVKELITNNNDMLPDWLDGLIKTTEKATISVTNPK